MKCVVLVCMLCALSIDGAFSQLAVVVDADGYANLRDFQDRKKVVGKVLSGDLVYCFGATDGWEEVDYTNIDGETGWALIHQSRLKDISKFTKIPMIRSSLTSANLKKDSIQVVLTEKKFVLGNRKIKKEKEYNVIVEIDNKPYWGCDGGLPQSEYKSIDITMGSSTISIPAEAICDLFNPNLSSTQVNYDSKNDVLYIQSMNSDGAGGYVVCWIIEKRKYKKRFVCHGF